MRPPALMPLGCPRDRPPGAAPAQHPTSRADTRSLPLRSAIVLATRSTRCCPRALSSPALASAAHHRLALGVEPHVPRSMRTSMCAFSVDARHRAAAPPGARARPSPARGPSWSSSAASHASRARRRVRDGRRRSMRSSSGPLSRRRWRAMSAFAAPAPLAVPRVAAGAGVRGRHEHEPGRIHRRVLRPAQSPRARPRAAGAAPRASGRANSESSSRNSTPLCASTTSPTHRPARAADQARRS